MAWEPPQQQPPHLPPPAPPPQQPAAKPAPKRRLGMAPWAQVALACIAALVVLVGVLGASSDDPDDDGDGDDDPAGNAVVACQLAVEDALKAPSTAEHPRIRDVTVEQRPGGAWHVDSWVDAENGFGAMIRTDYSCTVTRTAEGWRIDDLTLD